MQTLYEFLVKQHIKNNNQELHVYNIGISDVKMPYFVYFNENEYDDVINFAENIEYYNSNIKKTDIDYAIKVCFDKNNKYNGIFLAPTDNHHYFSYGRPNETIFKKMRHITDIDMSDFNTEYWEKLNNRRKR